MDDNLTLEKIADLAGVSRSTASRVLRNQGSVSQKARDSVMRVVEETGFQPNAAARSLAGHRTNIIGLYITEVSSTILNDPYFARLTEGVSRASNLTDQTLSLFLLHEEEDADKMTARILQNPLVDGIVISNTNIENPTISRLLDRNLPFVIVGRHEDPRVSFVDIDNIGGAFQATMHLIRQGYQRVSTITGVMNNYSAIDRLNGYKDAHKARGREIDESLIYYGTSNYYGTFNKGDGYDGAKALIQEGSDAIFAASDAIALGAMEAIQEAGLLIPEDIALVGFDDLPFAKTSNLTTIRQPIRQTGQLAVELLQEIVSNKENTHPRRIVLPTELVIRSTSG